VTRRCLYKWRVNSRQSSREKMPRGPSTHTSSYRTANPPVEAECSPRRRWRWIFQRCLAKSRGSTPEERRNWRDGIYDQMREVMSLQGSLSIERLCELTRVSRASFYRSFRDKHPVEEEMEVRSAIQQIAVEHRRRYGYRRITAELRTARDAGESQTGHCGSWPRTTYSLCGFGHLSLPRNSPSRIPRSASAPGGPHETDGGLPSCG